MTLKAGTVKDFAGSMAEDMEKALEKELQALKKVGLPAQNQEERRLLLCAIAQGVVRHLKDNAGTAFQIAVETTQSDGPIKSKGTATIKQVNVKGTLY